MIYDVIIIGAGIVGCVTARMLSRYQLNVLVLDKEPDIACGASKANSGILHAGYDCKPGTKKALLNVRGVHLFTSLAAELDIPTRNNGSLVICTNERDLPRLRQLYERGLQNSVSDLALLNREETLALEPNLTPDVLSSLWAKTAGIISPYEAAAAFAENSVMNGVHFLLDTAVTGVEKTEAKNLPHCFTVETTRGIYKTRSVVNASGVSSAGIHNSIGENHETIQPQRGQYYLLDNTQKNLVTRTIFQLPTKLGKGVLVVPTVDYNILLGPTAEPVDDPNDTQTTREGLAEIVAKTRLILNNVPLGDRITAFAGIRAKHPSKDFIIEETSPGFIDAVGIDSPGLSAAPAIGEEIEKLIVNRLQPVYKVNFIASRYGIKHFRELSFQEQEDLIRENPAYGHMVCRCETITEGEIIDAIRRPLGARSLDALKRRTRAQMGRCQGGFCTIRLIEILSRELGVKETDIVKNGDGSQVMI